MSLIFNANKARGTELRAMNQQWDHVEGYREASNEAVELLVKLTGNAGRTPADVYKEFDSTRKMEVKPAGHLATLSRLMQVSRSVNVGKKVYEFSKTSRAGTAVSSMDGQVGAVVDHTDNKYQGTVVPFHEEGFGRSFRDVQAGRSEAFDGIADDSTEAERTILEKVEDYLWNGDESLVVKGNSWLGLRFDTTVAQATVSASISSSAVAGKDIRNEFIRLRDILRITNDCDADLKVAVSRETMSNLERDYNDSNSSNVTIFEMISKLRGIAEIYEDAELVGDEVAMIAMAQDAMHPVTGMAISTYALPRLMHNAPFNFIKWCAVGFIAKTSYDGKRCALFAS